MNRLGTLPNAGYLGGSLVAFGLLNLIALALVGGHLALAVAVAVTPLATLGLARVGARIREVELGRRRFLLLWAALVASTLVWRSRTTADLNTNPLDSAGLVRVAWIALAVLLLTAWLPAILSASRRVPLPLRFVGLYVVVALVSSVASPLPFHAFYRFAELAVGLLAVLAAPRLIGENAGDQILKIVVATIAVILAVVWLEAIVMPSRAWIEVHYYGFIPVQLQGALPSFSSNTVGTLGALLALWGLATSRGNPTHRHAALTLGLLTLVATGYRTGLIGFLLASALVLFLQRRFGLTLLLVCAAIATFAAVGGNELQATGERAISHGQTDSEVQSLDSRTFYWDEAQTLVAERPLLGWGLNVGSREALAALGEENSTLHSTWFEALVGTGYLGLAFLGLAMLSALFYAWRIRDHYLGPPILAMLVLLAVRSTTGTTIELFSLTFLIFAALVVATGEVSPRVGSAAAASNRERA